MKIKNGMNRVEITLKIKLDNKKYIYTNKRRLSLQQPFENLGEQKNQEVKGLKELKLKYSQCVEDKKLPLVLIMEQIVL